ncbi:MAG: hypothetical protein QM706_01050 [Nitrospira sp.]
MKNTMQNHILTTAMMSALILTLGCQSLGIDSKRVVEFKYDHVANIENTVRFEATVPLAPPLTSTNQVISKWLGGFWAVFVICSVDVRGTEIESFTYDRTNFYVEYGGKTYGALQPYSLITTAEDDIGPQDTNVIENAIFSTLGSGPSTKVFGPGLSPSLNYRIAIFISDSTALPKALTLRYKGQPSILRGLGYSPANHPGYISGSPPLPGACGKVKPLDAIPSG